VSYPLLGLQRPSPAFRAPPSCPSRPPRPRVSTSCSCGTSSSTRAPRTRCRTSRSQRTRLRRQPRWARTTRGCRPAPWRPSRPAESPLARPG